MSHDPFIDLPPTEWESEREKPAEPFFGSGWAEALAYLIGLTVVVTATYFARTL